MGTMLIERGVNIDQCFEAINLKQPDVLEEITQLYFKAGADIVHTNTFGASPLKLAMYSLEDKCEEINRNAVQAVKRAVDDETIVAASVGPSGRLLKPYGDVEPENMLESYKKQIEVLVESGVDMLTIETMTDIEEAKLAIRAARSISNSIPIAVTMTYDPTPRGFYTIMGVDIKKAVMELEKAGADIIGSNCGNGIEKMIDIAREFKKYTSKPVVIQSNAGLPEIVKGKPVYKETPEFIC
jgi:5-methyltetrahydrofolate--homocysteine methyltransferase